MLKGMDNISCLCFCLYQTIVWRITCQTKQEWLLKIDALNVVHQTEKLWEQKEEKHHEKLWYRCCPFRTPDDSISLSSGD